MAEYDKFLEEVHNIGNAHRSKARQYIPKMYQAIRNENPNLTSEGARDRIEKDCFDIWSKRTILDALPDETKDQKKQKAGRLSQKEPSSAAFSTAPLSTNKKEIIIDTQGKPIEKDTPSPSPTTTPTSLCLFLLLERRLPFSCSSYFDSISLEMVSNSVMSNPVNDLNNNGFLESRA